MPMHDQCQCMLRMKASSLRFLFDAVVSRVVKLGIPMAPCASMVSIFAVRIEAGHET